MCCDGQLMGFGPVGMLLFSVEFEFLQTLWDGLVVCIRAMLGMFGVFLGFFSLLHTFSVGVGCMY